MDSYDLSVFINEYFLNNAFWAAFYANQLNFTAPIPTKYITTTTLKLGLPLSSHGFHDNQPCQLVLKADPNGTPPTI
jgi:hypothetical protein